jgi:hypothetical protein
MLIASGWRKAVVVLVMGAGLMAFLLPTDTQAQQQCIRRQETTVFGTWISPNIELTEKTKRFVEYAPAGIGFGVASMRLLLKDGGGTSTRWTLTIRDSQYRVLISLGPGDLAVPPGGGDKQRWTGLLTEGVVKLDLTTNDGGTVRLKIAIGLLYPPASQGERQFSVQGPEETWKPLYSSTHSVAKQVGDSVGMLAGAAQAGSHKVSWCCSGVMLSPSIFLTNWHCGGMSGLQDAEYWGKDICRNTIVDLSWDDKDLRRQFACAAVLLVNRPLDFALLRIEPIIGAGQLMGQPRPAELAPGKALGKNDEIFMVHHALCLGKLVSDKCYVDASKRPPWRQPTAQSGEESIADDPDPGFTHLCDTEPGASGAPVFDSDGKVVGLHHLGFDLDAQCVPDKRNKAVKIKEILKVIKRDAPTVAAEIGIPDAL